MTSQLPLVVKTASNSSINVSPVREYLVISKHIRTSIYMDGRWTVGVAKQMDLLVFISRGSNDNTESNHCCYSY